MHASTIVWIIVTVVAIAVVVALVWSLTRSRRVEARRTEAAELREEAAEHDRLVREREAEATELEARAQRARAEAMERAAQADRLASEALRRGESVESARETRDNLTRLADARDPDLPTDAEGHRREEDGDRLDEDAPGHELPDSRVDADTNPHAQRDNRPGQEDRLDQPPLHDDASRVAAVRTRSAQEHR